MFRKRLKQVAITAVVALALTSGAYYGVFAGSNFTVAASSPDNAGGMTLAVAVPKVGLRATDGDASYFIKYNGQIIYPPGGKGASFKVTEGAGSLFVPYNIFVVGNGEYEIVVTFDGVKQSATTRVHKWVNYVFMVPVQKRSGSVTVDVVLSDLMGGSPANTIITAGELILDIRYRGEDGNLNVPAHRMKVPVTGEKPVLQVQVPKTAFTRGEGYYSFDATFYNEQALGNNAARTDPT
ncbi:MAG TPA: hypothetical protein VNZ52_10765, partial [Candidatus Thermoplasmatota archaeon]|nr:hypothetical protein [Candidatus Thermoplasmatota archaeon]